MEALDTNNIKPRRTRGKVIDFAKAAQENPAEDEDSDDDGDYEEGKHEHEDDEMDED